MAKRRPSLGKDDSIESGRPLGVIANPAEDSIKIKISLVEGSEFFVSMDAENFQKSLPELMVCALQLGIPWPKVPS